MKKEIIINATANEIRVAITEEKRLAELFVETPEKERMVGDIHLGKVAKIMPGIRAAFVDIGMKQDAFLHFSDIGDTLSEYAALLGDDDSDVDTDDEGEDEDSPSSPQNGSAPTSVAAAPRTSHQRPVRQNSRAQNLPNLTSGQDIMVQITKEPVGKKGVRVTSEISLPGRFLVLLPFDGKIGISKKINSFKEKRRLRRIIRSILPEGFGVIVRTVATDKEEAILRQDLESLLATWKEIEQSIKTEKSPALLYKDLATTSSVIRDLFTEDVERVVTDSKKLYKDICAYVKSTSGAAADKIELYRGKEPIFDVYGVEKEIAATLSRKVWMKSGGYIIIEQTEAMFVIDVNSGRYAAKQEQEMNSLKTDLEAAREVTRQLRLRDIGGIIVVDFIDLDDERNRKKVYDELRKEFRKDRARVTVLPMTEFGLVQITRQRIRQNILQSFSEPCPVCGGAGMVQSKSSIVNQIERMIRRFKTESREFRLLLKVHPNIAEYLRDGTFSRLLRIMLKFRVYVKLETDSKLPIAEFRMISVKQGKDITSNFHG